MTLPHPPSRTFLILAILFPLAACGCGGASDADKALPSPPRIPGKPDVGFVPTPDGIVDRMLELAEIQPEDVVYDLGCGDGKIVIAAAKKYGVKAVGIDIDPKMVAQAKENVKKREVEKLVTIRQGDIFEEDFSDATVVTLYLLPELNVKLMPKLTQMPNGTRIVSHSFAMKGARPEKVETVLGKKVYLWRVPWKGE
jgi:SAM-dependent methyltransferase